MKPFIAPFRRRQALHAADQFHTWGFYYNKDLFEKAGLTPPKTGTSSWLQRRSSRRRASSPLPSERVIFGRTTLVRLSEPARERPRISYGADGRERVVHGSKESKKCSSFGRTDQKGLFYRECELVRLAGGDPVSCPKARRACICWAPYVRTSLPAELHDKIGLFKFPEVNARGSEISRSCRSMASPFRAVARIRLSRSSFWPFSRSRKTLPLRKGGGRTSQPYRRDLG